MATDLLREQNPSPRLRAAIVEVLAGLGLDLLDRQADGSVTVAITDSTRPSTPYTATIRPDGTLAAESVIALDPLDILGVPEGTVLSTARHEASQILRNLPDG